MSVFHLRPTDVIELTYRSFKVEASWDENCWFLRLLNNQNSDTVSGTCEKFDEVISTAQDMIDAYLLPKECEA